jgi:hypothetical protein
VRHCGKLELLDRLLGKLKAGGHRVLLFCTMTRLLDVLEEYLAWRGYEYLRLDGSTGGAERGEVVNAFQAAGSTAFVFLLSVRAGGFGLNLQSADTVIMYDTDWNPQVDAQAQARSHRIGQTKDVLVLRLETVGTVEEGVRAAAARKLDVAERAITGGCFDGGQTSEQDRATFLQSLLRAGAGGAGDGTGEALPDNAALNALIARNDAERALFDAEDATRAGAEQRYWARLLATAPPGSLPAAITPRLAGVAEAAPIVARMTARADAAAAAAAATQELGRGARKRVQHAGYVEIGQRQFNKLCEQGAEGAPVLLPLKLAASPPGAPVPEPRLPLKAALNAARAAAAADAAPPDAVPDDAAPAAPPLAELGAAASLEAHTATLPALPPVPPALLSVLPQAPLASAPLLPLPSAHIDAAAASAALPPCAKPGPPAAESSMLPAATASRRQSAPAAAAPRKRPAKQRTRAARSTWDSDQEDTESDAASSEEDDASDMDNDEDVSEVSAEEEDAAESDDADAAAAPLPRRGRSTAAAPASVAADSGGSGQTGTVLPPKASTAGVMAAFQAAFGYKPASHNYEWMRGKLAAFTGLPAAVQAQQPVLQQPPAPVPLSLPLPPLPLPVDADAPVEDAALLPAVPAAAAPELGTASARGMPATAAAVPVFDCWREETRRLSDQRRVLSFYLRQAATGDEVRPALQRVPSWQADAFI